ncbi:MAG: CsiV family protein [Pseudomonas sp.]
MKLSTRHLRHPLLAIALLTGSLLAQAQELLVELVVFSQPSAELMPASAPGYDWAERAVVLDDTVRSDVLSIDPTRHQLDSDARKLQNNGYQIQFHRAWTQPADGLLSVAVHQGESLTAINEDPLYPVQGLVSVDSDPLTAKVTLWLNHATADMAEPVSERLQTTRRLRLGETHYLDHRSMGALIRVSRP